MQENYAIMSCAGSMGEGYGPMLVATRKYALDEIKKLRIAIPGTLTTAFLTLKLFAPELNTTVVDFDKIIPAVAAGEFDAGLLIHEGQLTYGNEGLHKILDLGQWWRTETGLPLPLGGSAIKRSLGPEVMLATNNAIRDSIKHALEHREGALDYAMQFARDLDPNLASRYVGMYVNDRTLDYGPDGREAIRRILDMGYDRGIITVKPEVDFIG
jgi:1,4-dihydroxy-6-naphthoate synthase